MTTFRHSGKMGDLVFSLPTIKALSGGNAIVYLPENGPESEWLFSGMKRLLEAQPYISEVREYPSGLPYMKLEEGIQVDVDLDKARLQPGKGVVHIVRRYLDAFNISLANWKEPWLTAEGANPIPGEYVVINYTGRHILNEQLGVKSRVDWRRVHNSISDKKIFMGTKEEHKNYCEQFGLIDYYKTNDVLEMALVVKYAKAVYCNQSLVLALAQSLGVEYYADFKPGKTNCMLFAENEHRLL